VSLAVVSFVLRASILVSAIVQRAAVILARGVSLGGVVFVSVVEGPVDPGVVCALD
jgi:hypothetical protein